MEPNKTPEELKGLVQTEPDFINSKKHKYSLKKFLDQNPGGTTDHIIAIFLCMSPEEVRLNYSKAVEKIRQKMKVVVK